MRAPAVATLSVVSAMLGAGLVACFDLLHSTRDVLTACEIDSHAANCGADASTDASPAAVLADAGTDFCGWSSQRARSNAQHACAWLGACETPMGRNAFGSCMFQALLSYDCGANPNHRGKGKAHDLWDCLWQVTSCGDVEACVFPLGPEVCGSPGDYTACGTRTNSATSNFDVRIECVDAGTPPGNAHGENCALWGQTCADDGGIGACAGERGLECARGCFGPNATELRWCVDGGDLGIDCASNGAQRCDVFPDAGADTGPDASTRWVACVAETDAAPCAPDASAACVNGIASSCSSGQIETIDCARILQSDAGCRPGLLGPPFDWTSACAVSPAQCTADSCTDSGLIGCARGAAFTLDCAAVGLGACRSVPTDTLSSDHAACTAGP
jgi:hypothetical protein